MLVANQKLVKQALANVSLESLGLSKQLNDMLKQVSKNKSIDTTSLLKALRG